MAYVDGFLIPVPKRKLATYRGLARRAGRIWREYGALEYRECVGDDLGARSGSFAKSARLKPGEAVIFSWIVFRSKRHRDSVNAKVLADPRIQAMMNEPSPFDVKRMAYGGFTVIVDV